MRRALTLPVLISATMCLGCLGIDSDEGLRLDWSVLEGELPQTVNATASRATIRVVGQIPANLPCDPLDGDVSR